MKTHINTFIRTSFILFSYILKLFLLVCNLKFGFWIICKKEFCSKKDTYVKWFLQNDPSRFRLNFKVVHVLWIVWCRYRINNSSIIVSIFIRGRNTQNIRSNACILFDIFDVFLEFNKEKSQSDGIPRDQNAIFNTHLTIEQWRLLIQWWMHKEEREKRFLVSFKTKKTNFLYFKWWISLRYRWHP